MARCKSDIIILSSEDEEITKQAKEAYELHRQQLARRKRKIIDRDKKRRLSIFKTFNKQKCGEPPLHNVTLESNSLNAARGSCFKMNISPKSSPHFSFSDGGNHQNVSY